LQPNPVGLEIGVLASILLCVAFVALTLAESVHLGLSQRYVLPAVIGNALIVGALSSVRHQLIRSSTLLLAILSVGLTIAPAVQFLGRGSVLNHEGRLRAVSRLVPRGQDPLPIVISSGIGYLPMAYYIQGNPRLYSIVDPPMALKFNGSESVDLALFRVRHYFRAPSGGVRGIYRRTKSSLLFRATMIHVAGRSRGLPPKLRTSDSCSLLRIPGFIESFSLLEHYPAGQTHERLRVSVETYKCGAHALV
jgi:hypothetical protein